MGTNKFKNFAVQLVIKTVISDQFSSVAAWQLHKSLLCFCCFATMPKNGFF